MADKKNKSGTKSSYKRKAVKDPKKIKRNVEIGEIVRWLLALFALFVILTFFPFINSGIFGPAVSNVLKGTFGPMYYVLPFVFIIVVIFWRKDWANNIALAKYMLYIGEFIFVSIIVHVAVAGENAGHISFFNLYSTGVHFKSAGIIGGSVAEIFVTLFGKVPSVIISFVGAFIFTVLLCGKTPKDTVKVIVKYIKDSVNKVREAQRADEEEEEEEEALAPRRVKKPKADAYVELPDDPEEEIPAEEIPAAEPYPVAVPADLPDDPADISAGLTDEADISSPDNPKPAAQEAVNDFDLEEDEEELCLEPIEDTPYVFPPISLLTADAGTNARPSQADIARTARRLEELLLSFNVKTKVIDTTFGPTVTRYELQPETGVRVKSIVNLADDISLHLAADAVRIENIPGKAAVGIEIPNKNASMVRLRRLIENITFKDAKSRLYTALGEDVAGNPVYLDIAKMPHLLVAGATGQGKSVCINSLILSLLYRNHPNDVKLILIDPKTVEFADFKDIPHLLVPVINDPKNAAGTLSWACSEMEKRYRLIQEVGARNLEGYNTAVANDPEREMMPQIVIFIDEFADLMMTAPDDVETSVCRLAQKARAAGMHLVIGTQRPSVDVITGLIKANIPSRIALTTASPVDSRTIIEQVGAEKLLGKGDMLYFPVGAMKPMRVQGAFVSSGEVQAVTQFIKEAAHAQYDESIMKQIEDEAKRCGMKGKRAMAEDDGDAGNEKLDPKFMEALEIAIDSGTISTSMIQARLALGYGRAARIISIMERRGYIGEFDAATKKRKILITREQYAELKMNGDKAKDGE
ncbi:MAG: DUF87 domain-containing protein [Clostridia bacterium]|nr:DUF87 domain-containing protein [Clostridia bacterium]